MCACCHDLEFFTVLIYGATKLEVCPDTGGIYIPGNGVLAIHARCVLEITCPWNGRHPGFSVTVCWSSLTTIRLGVFLARRKTRFYCACPEAEHCWEWARRLNEDRKICHPQKPNRGVSAWMVLLGLTVSLPTVIWLTPVPSAVTA